MVQDNPVALGLFRGHLERQLDAKLAEAHKMMPAEGARKARVLWTPNESERIREMSKPVGFPEVRPEVKPLVMLNQREEIERLGKRLPGGFEPVPVTKPEVPDSNIPELIWEDFILMFTKEEAIQRYKDGPKAGQIKSVLGTQVHHIVHQSLKNHELWGKAVIDIEDRFHKMLLPTKEGAEVFDTTRTIHQGRHLKEVERELCGKREYYESVAKAAGWIAFTNNNSYGKYSYAWCTKLEIA